uniref:Uncharacterized protein n=1 Tax=Romanomermis culicivorax TaxID=13658 RepID=A0A915HKJ1_ROMCU
MFCFVVFALLSIVSSKSIFHESLAYVDLSDDLVQAVEKVGIEEGNTERKKQADFHPSSTNRLEVSAGPKVILLKLS